MLSLILDDTTTANSNYMTFIMLGILVVAIVVMFIVSSKRNKKRQEEAENLINAVKPGNKVKTIGGICGIVVEVDDEENTFVLETGSEASGKCFLKFDRQAIYQTDAVTEKTDKKDKKGDKEEKEEKEEKVEETSATEEENK
jgi:preprotein translocase subunit YajC